MIVTKENKWKGIIRKIKCPKHFRLIFGRDPYIREINPMYRKLPRWAFKKFKIPMNRIVKDRFGRPMVNYKNFEQPEITAGFAIEHIYDPKNWICEIQCKRRCFEGQGKVSTSSIRRLNM